MAARSSSNSKSAITTRNSSILGASALRISAAFTACLRICWRTLSKANYSNVDALDRAFAKYSLAPWLINIEQALSAKLLGPRQRNSYFIEHDLNGLLRGDYETRARGYQAAVYTGWLSPNDVRRLENLAPRPGGDEYLQPSNLLNPQQLKQQQQSGENQ